MTSIVSRVFSSRDQAEAAVAALRRHIDFAAARIDVETPADAAALARAGVERAGAEAAFPGAGPGSTLVTLRAPFGTALTATRVLDQFGPVALGGRGGVYSRHDDPAPLSRALGLPLLLHQAAPFSRLFGLPTLTRRQLGSARLIANPAPFSSALRLPLLTRRQSGRARLLHNPAPFSSALRMKLLTSRQQSHTRLYHNPTPLSSALGLPVLIRD